LPADIRTALPKSKAHSSILGHKNWQIETAIWNLAGFLHCALETRWQRSGQFLNDLLKDFMLESQDSMLDFRKIVSEIQHKIAILVEKSAKKIAKNRVGNPT